MQDSNPDEPRPARMLLGISWFSQEDRSKNNVKFGSQTTGPTRI
ncbi:MAG: hypothetical protein QN835_09370 [Nitrososphaeraceae archaeon]|nr:hypothetical protein [Nitrososphaeraceae archaeon]